MPPIQIVRPFYYFQPNQLAMRVSSKGDTPNSDAIASSWDFINSEAKRLFDYKDVAFPAPADNVRQFSFTLQTDQGAVTKTFAFRNRHESLASQDPHDVPALVERINNGNDQRKQDLGLEMVDLNWLGCGGGNGNWGGDGGPGGPPWPFPFPDTGMPNHIPHLFDGDIVRELNAKGNRGEGISVAILDTAPSDSDLDTAYLNWVTKAKGKDHPLLKELWAPPLSPKPLTIIRMTDATRARLSSYSLEKHPYSISDHGSFIAGVIHTIAREAELYLYEALNDHGMCDSESVLAGLDWVNRNLILKGKRVVINCSLFLLIPYNPGQYNVDITASFPSQSPWDNAQGMEAWLEKQGKFSEPVFQYFSTKDSAVIAAAGNDWHGTGDRPLARYPAAFESVQGVGALDDGQSGNVAPYSNLDDSPPTGGILAFGGDPDPKKGVLGLYVSPTFPDMQNPGNTLPNNHGWARWAGTSFATPLISGLVTAMMSDAGGGNATNVVSDLRINKTTPNPNKEHALKANQS